MKNRLLTLLVTLLCACNAIAQKYSVTGTVMEKETQEAIMAATVQVLNVKDSSYVAGTATDIKGSFTIRGLNKMKYIIKVSFVGYGSKSFTYDMGDARQHVGNLGVVLLEQSSHMLKEATITAQASQVQVSGDSLVYNASAYRVAEGSALEELVKKMPGAEVDDEGNIKINGKTVKKILVDGKEFFLNDTKLAMKNIPTNIIDKIKSYDMKSDMARVTGIDDGEEETVLDLSIKRGMNQGWLGNFDLAMGTQHRYAEKMLLRRSIGKNSFTLLGNANNNGDRGFGGGGGRGGWGRGGNGLQSGKTLGFNASTTSDKLETNSNVFYRYNGSDNWNYSSTQNFVTATGTFNNRRNQSYSSSNSVNANFRFEWKPDSMTNIIFRPSGNWSHSYGSSASESVTFNHNPNSVTDDPLAWGYTHREDMTDTIYNMIVNTNFSRQQTENSNRGINGELQYNRRLNNRGRNITFRATGGLSGSDSKQLSAAQIYYRQNPLDTNNNNRYYVTPGRSSNYSLQLSYSEPIADRTYLQFLYRFNYSYNKNDRQAFTYANDPVQYTALSEALSANRYNIEGVLDWMLAHDYELLSDSVANRLSQYSVYRNYNHTAGVSFRKVTDKFNFNVGVEVLPQHSELDYKYLGVEYPTVKRNVLNVSPTLDFKYDFSKTSQFRITYRGRTSQPGMTNLLEITDDSNPLNITTGNSGLKPSFTSSMNLFYNTYNAEYQRGVFTWAGANVVQNSIANRTSYDAATGVTTTRPENINGNWSLWWGGGFNTAIDRNKYFTFNTNPNFSFNRNVSYLNPLQYQEERSRTNQINVGDRTSFGFRKDWFEMSLNGNFQYSHSRNNVVKTANLDTWSFGYGAEFNFNMSWGTSLSTDISESSRRGYSQSSMNTNELIWNMQVSHSFLKGKSLTISAQWNDILRNRSNISRAISAMSSSDSRYNAIYSYGMIHVIYKFNIFGGKNAQGGGPGGPGFGGPGGPGGPGGRRPF